LRLRLDRLWRRKKRTQSWGRSRARRRRRCTSSSRSKRWCLSLKRELRELRLSSSESHILGSLFRGSFWRHIQFRICMTMLLLNWTRWSSRRTITLSLRSCRICHSRCSMIAIGLWRRRAYGQELSCKFEKSILINMKVLIFLAMAGLCLAAI